MPSERYSFTVTIDPLEPHVAKKLGVSQLPVLQADVMQRWTRKRYREVWAARTQLAIMCQTKAPAEPLKSAEITAIRFCTGTPPDWPNVVYSFKPIIDSLVGWIIEDDNPSVLLSEKYYSVRVRTKAEQRLEISLVGV